jgi:hypothetical protein
MMSSLNPEKALIFRIVHRENVPWILANGLHCKNSNKIDPKYVSIGNPDLIDKRSNHPVPCRPGGTLGDYVPFYFTPFSPMLLNIKTGWGDIRKRPNEEIVILVSSLNTLKDKGIRFIFTDRHAYLRTAQFFSDLAHLDQIDWAILRQRDLKRDPDDPGKFERYQAEALVHKSVPCDALLGIGCYNDLVAADLRRVAVGFGLTLRIIARGGWFF